MLRNDGYPLAPCWSRFDVHRILHRHGLYRIHHGLYHGHLFHHRI